jgi:hypothetical protein
MTGGFAAACWSVDLTVAARNIRPPLVVRNI